MTLPDSDTINTFGGATIDYSPPWDSRWQRASKYFCRALASVGATTRTAIRSQVTIQAGSPYLSSSANVWDNGAGAKPTVANTGTGIYVITFPTTVPDEILSGFPGYNSTGHYLNARGGWVTCSGSADLIATVKCSVTIATVYVRSASSRSLTNLSGTNTATLYVI